MKTVEKARFDTRLSKEQKEYFEYAASIGGFRNLTEFIVSSAKQQADKIIESHNVILASQRDNKVFFDALMKTQKPNAQLKKAASRYNKAIVSK